MLWQRYGGDEGQTIDLGQVFENYFKLNKI